MTTAPRLVSVIVCTRNRAEKLARTLDAIAEMTAPAGTGLEIVIADNGSTDDTVRVCDTFARTFRGAFGRVFVREPGLSRARNAGVAAAHGDIIAFIDDDIFPASDWLVTIRDEFGADQELAIISGRVELKDPSALPMSIRRQTARAQLAGVFDSFGLCIGCNFAARRAVFDRVGPFDPEFGAGTRFAAEDGDFFYRAWQSGAKVIYEPRLFVWHDHGRHSAADELSLKRSYLTGRGAFYAKHIRRRDGHAARALYWELDAAVRRRPSALSGRECLWLLRGLAAYLITRRPASRAVRAGTPSRVGGTTVGVFSGD